MTEKIRNIIKDKRLRRYFVMACVVVLFEILLFQMIYLQLGNYGLATVGSFIFGVILNWIFSRRFVFGASLHHPLKEFIMVGIASLVGAVIQLLIVFVSVEFLLLYPLFGKVVSIAFSFVWNYWFRLKFIFKSK